MCVCVFTGVWGGGLKGDRSDEHVVGSSRGWEGAPKGAAIRRNGEGEEQQLRV